MSVLLLSKFLNKKAVITVLSKQYWQSLSGQRSLTWIKRLRSGILKNADKFIVLNRHLISILEQDHIAPDLISFIPNGTEVPKEIKDKERMKKELHLPSQGMIALYAGRLHRQKNIPFLLRSWKKLNDQGASLHMLLLGDGPDMEHIKSIIEHCHLEKNVRLLGFKADVNAYMNAADIFILPSASEGCSNALLEAMSHGLACIASRSKGNDEIIADGINGSLIEFNNEGELMRAVKHLSRDHERRRQLGEAARNTVRNRYSINDIACVHIQTYINGSSSI